MADYGSVGHFRSFFSFGVTLGPFVSGGQFRILGSLWVDFWSGSHFGLILGLGVNFDQFWVQGSFWIYFRFVVTLGPFWVFG